MIGPAVNAARGEVGLEVGGRTVRLCLTLGALAELEAAFGVERPAALAERLRAMGGRELLVVLSALARGGGQALDAEAFAGLDPRQAAEAVARCFEAAAT